jgi:hypothetical protein
MLLVGNLLTASIAFAQDGAAPNLPAVTALVKVAHLAPFANTLDGTSVTVKVDGAPALTNVKFGNITGYLPFTPGSHKIDIIPTGSSTIAITGTFNLVAGTSYTLSAIGDVTHQPLELFALVDDNSPPATGARLRVAHFAPFDSVLANTKVDICTSAGTVVPGLSNIPYKGFTTPYLNLPAGTYGLKITAAGSNCATDLFDIAPFTLKNGEVVSAYAIGDITNLPLAVTITLDQVRSYFPLIFR